MSSPVHIVALAGIEPVQAQGGQDIFKLGYGLKVQVGSIHIKNPAPEFVSHQVLHTVPSELHDCPEDAPAFEQEEEEILKQSLGPPD